MFSAVGWDHLIIDYYYCVWWMSLSFLLIPFLLFHSQFLSSSSKVWVCDTHTHTLFVYIKCMSVLVWVCEGGGAFTWKIFNAKTICGGFIVSLLKYCGVRSLLRCTATVLFLRSQIKSLKCLWVTNSIKPFCITIYIDGKMKDWKQVSQRLIHPLKYFVCLLIFQVMQ